MKNPRVEVFPLKKATVIRDMKKEKPASLFPT